MEVSQMTVNAAEIARIVNDSGLGLEQLRKDGLLPVNVKAARKIMNDGGYQYDRATKQWTQDAAAPIAKPLPAAAAALSDDEVIALKQLAQQILSGNKDVTPVTNESPDVQLYERTRRLPKSTTTRKTYVVDDQIAARFDALADRSNIDKSQLLTLALTDFLTKYDG